MEAPERDDTPALPLAMDEGGKDVSEIRASEEAIMFINGIDPIELPKCVFEDSLVTISEGGRDLGSFYVSVEFARRACRPCMLLHAQSQGAIDNSPCGTTVTAYLTADLEVLEEEHHEYVKLSDHILDKRCHMVQHDGEMKINKVTTVGNEVTTESVSYSMSALRGLVTEGSNFLLMRIIALRKKIPEHMTLISFDQKLQIARTTFRGLEEKLMEIDGETVEVFGVERTVHWLDEDPTTWQCYFLSDGHLASRLQVGSPITMRLLQLPSQKEEGTSTAIVYTNSSIKLALFMFCVYSLFVFSAYEKIPLVWEEDIQMRSKFLDRKEELKADHASYLKANPEIRALISDFLQFLLLKKPDDVFQFAREYFFPFTSDTNLDTSPH
ncbi:ciliogenesis-associated TTC17-interacting protein isoform X1 [Corythoichthys intestinalis]|uniref:ciliogenesis-associated TTC17-interacting protein isoform X1 n=1 Tax=Corythoichthys intestinalis TaxID=161448 RepID=UPI0025A686C7|nr:ciliogenesis-associated TTC17-interacting protein isoform X1 [Corythoichthys intestinalis]